MSTNRFSLALCASVAMLMAACSSTPIAQQDPATIETGLQPYEDAPSSQEIASLTDGSGPLSERDIFFEYDSYIIRNEYRMVVQAHARLLRKYPNLNVLIQGHADERGSREYNLALGQKRAEAIKKALLILGARESQVEAVSLGEEKNVCAQSEETCWSQNRRGHILHKATQEF